MKRTWMRSLFCCAMLGLLVGCGQSPEQMFEQAKALSAKGDRQGATLQVKSLLQDSPDNAAARLLLGQLNLEAGDFAGAEKELRRAQDGKAPAEQILPLLAKALVMQGDGKKVLAEIDPAKVTDPTAVARLHAMRGTAHLLLRQKDEAQAEFDKALAVKPAFPDALVGSARILAGERKWAEALAAVEMALGSDSADQDAMMLKGDLLRASGKSAEAEEAYKKLVAAHPQHVTGLLAMVSLTVASNRLEEADKYVGDVRKASPGNPMATYFQGLIAFRRNDYKAARDAIGAVLKVAPNHLPSVLLGGAVEFALGSQELAQTRLKYVLERAPRNVYARRVLAASYARAGQTQKALETLEPAISGGLKDPAMLALAGEVYMQLNEYEKAEGFFEKAAALDPKNARMRTGLGLSRLAGGDIDAATADLENATQLDTTRTQSDVLLVATHLQRKNFDKALKAAQALISKQPDSPVGHNLAAAAYLGKRDEKAARGALVKALEVQATYVPAAANLAQLELQSGDKKAARKWLEDIIAKDKKNVQAYMTLSTLGSRIDANEAEVRGWLEAALRENPGTIAPLLSLSELHLRNKQPKRALEIVEKELLATPERPELLELVGRVQLASGEKIRALATFTKLAAVQPSAMAFFSLGNAQLANDDRKAAIGSYRKALEFRPNFPEAQFQLAETYARTSQFTEALGVATLLQQTAPKAPGGWIVEGNIHVAAKKFGDAVRAYQRAFSMAPSGLSVVKLHSALARDGKANEGESRLKEWLMKHPTDAGTRSYLAEQFISTKRYREAIEHYEYLANQRSSDFVALNNLAWAYLQVNDKRAAAAAEKALTLRPDDASIMDTLGMVLLSQGEIERAVEILRKAVAAAPKLSEVQYHYVQALVKSGDRKGALSELERLLVNSSDFAQRPDAKQLLAELRKDVSPIR